MSRRLNLSVRDIELLEHLAASRRLAGMFPGKSAFLLLRETYFDTPDGLLRERGMKLCLRVEARGRQVVELTVQDVVNLQGVVEETVERGLEPISQTVVTFTGPFDYGDQVARAAIRASLWGGNRPFGGSMRIDVRNWPSILNASVPRSIQNEL